MSNKTHLGLEINDQVIRYVELAGRGADLALGQYGEIRLPEGMIEEGSIRQGAKLLELLESLNKSVKKKRKWKDTTVSHLPDQVFLADILKEAGFKNIYFESAGEAVARTAMPQDSPETAMLVYFTGKNMDIYAGSRQGAQLLATYNFSSYLLEKPNDAEIVAYFIKEKIDEQYVSWHAHKNEEKGGNKKRPRISRIILAGIMAEPEKLADYLVRALKLRTELAQVWTNVFSLDKHIPEINFRDSLRYAAAVGLALRPFEK